jgi:heterodisulfide reductase subunit B2
MKYLYYPGCSVKGTAREYEESFKSIAPILGIEIETAEDWVCCGATVAKSVSRELADDLPKRAILEGGKAGLDLLMLCPSCHLNHVRVLKESQTERNAMEGPSPDRYPAVKQLLEVLAFDLGWDKIKKKVTRPLKGVKAAPYYGCLVIRPYGLGGKESLENPRTMENLISSAGGDPVPFPYKMDCCGGGLLLSKEKVALKLGSIILREAKKTGTDCLVVACPLCHFMLDAKQRTIEKETGEKMGIPVLYVSQFLGLALGLEPRKLGLHRLLTSPRSLLEKF